MNKVTQAPILTTHIKFLSYAFLSLLACLADVAKAGVDEWTSLGLETAQTNAIAVAPSNPAIVYVGTNGGTVFKSTDSGATWQALNTEMFSISSLAIDPLNPDTIYAASESTGVFKSSDGGANWQHLLGNLNASDVEIDPRNPSTVYASAFSGSGVAGVLKTTDGGASWQVINNGLTSAAITVLALAPSDSMTLYAGSIGGLVFKTTDAGATWQDSGFGNSGSIRALAVDPNNPAIVYAGTSPGGSLPSGVFKSTDGGASWQAVNNGLTALHIRDIAINPSNPNIVYAGTLDGGVFKSTDSGATWQAVNTGLADLVTLDLAFDPGNPATVYAVVPNAGVYRITFSAEVSVPVLIVPGILGSWSTELFADQDGNVDQAQVGDAERNFARAKRVAGRCTGRSCLVPMPESWTLDPFFGEYNRLRSELSASGFTVVDAPYDWRLPISLSAHVFLKAKIEETKSRFGVSQVDIVAHSMGGLLARAYIQGGEYAGDIRKLIMLGTPNHGAAVLYYPWEGGRFFLESIGGLPANLVQEILLENMKQAMGLGNISDREFIIANIKSILDMFPTYPFLTNQREQFVSLEDMCARNTYLETLNTELSSLTQSGVQIQTFVGTGNRTPIGFRVRRPRIVDCSEGTFLATKWPDGTPQGAVFRDGDSTVVTNSVELPGIPSKRKTAEHTCVDTNRCLNIEFIPDVIDFLNSANTVTYGN